MDPDTWLEVDEALPDYLAEKHRLIASAPERVFVETEDSRGAQEEVLSLVAGFLRHRYPEYFGLAYGKMKIAGVVEPVDLEDKAVPPLLRAAYLTQEDLVIMRKGKDGWRLVAGSVCFPSSWVLGEKFGKPMQEIHRPVPGFGPGSQNADRINRIFDNLRVEQPVERFNWSVYNDNKLFHDDRSAEHFPDRANGEESRYLRVERQTLRKLAGSGDILFTIRIHIDPIEMLAKRADKHEIAGAFITCLQGMDADQLEYKGLSDGRNRLIETLREMTG